MDTPDDYIVTLIEAGLKLGGKSHTIASAATYFHRFAKDCDAQVFDMHLIGATCLYLAGKV